MTKNDPYSQAVNSGMYRREKGIRRKYDNVRIFWEDEIIRIFLKPYIENRLHSQKKKGKKLRILDLGCGSGDGYELFREMNKSNTGILESKIKLLDDDSLGLYKGIENNKDLLAQNRERWGEKSKMICSWGDFSQGLPLKEKEKPYDIYFASYGVMSHINDDQTVQLFSDIIRHAENGSIIMGDWLGRYSYEWQELWNDNTRKEQWMDYYISYIYPPEKRKNLKLTPLKLRLMSRDEIMNLVKRIEKNMGEQLEVEEIYDRSLFVGRHMDTNDYNKYLHPLRNQVNLLFERGSRTDLQKLKLNYHHHTAIRSQNKYFEEFSSVWNALIDYTVQLLKELDRKEESTNIKYKEQYPDNIHFLFENMKCIIKNIDCFQMDDVRADCIEPQLGYCLRDLEMSLQQGQGNGHGLTGIFSIKKH